MGGVGVFEGSACACVKTELGLHNGSLIQMTNSGNAFEHGSKEAAANNERLMKMAGEYIYTFELCASKIRGLSRASTQGAYVKVAQQWAGVMLPPKGDEKKREGFFSLCDGICDSTPVTPEE
jgi:hypothetical protein